jgi:Uma2 family endonuclease
MGAAKILLTAEQFDNYPFEEDKRYELDEGELIVADRPAYKHNRVVARLTVKLFSFFEQSPLGEVLISENVYALSPTTRRSRDVAVILGD